MADQTVAIRLALKGADDIIRQLSRLGEDGQEAIARLATKAAEAAGRFDLIAAGADKVGAALRALSGSSASSLDAQVAGLARLAAAQKNAADILNGLPAGGLKIGTQAAADLAAVKTQAEATGAALRESVAINRDVANSFAAIQERGQALDPAYQRQIALANVRAQAAQLLGARLFDEAQAARFLEAEYRLLDPAYARLAADGEKYLATLSPAIGLQRLQADVARQVKEGIYDEVVAYDRLTEAALKAANVKLQPGQVAPQEVRDFATVDKSGATKGAADAAIAALKELDVANEQAAAGMARLKEMITAGEAAVGRLADSAQRYKEAADPAIALDRLRAETLEQVRLRLLTAAEAQDRLTQAALKATGAEEEEAKASAALQRFSNTDSRFGSAGAAVDELNALRAYKEGADEAAQVRERLKQAVDAERAALNPLIGLKAEEQRLNALVATTDFTEAEAKERLAQITESLFGTLSSEAAAYRALYDDADRYKRSLDPTIALEEERTRVLEQFRIGALNAEEAQNKLTAALLKQVGFKGEGLATTRDIAEYTNVEKPGGDAGKAVEDAQRLAAADEEATAASKRLVAAQNEEAASIRQVLAQANPMLEVKRLEAILAKAAGSADYDEAQAKVFLAAQTNRANAAIQQMTAEAGGNPLFSGKGRIAFEITNASEQLRQFIEQISYGTNFLQAIGQQLPQAFVGFSPIVAILGAAVAGALGAATAFLGTGDASKQAAEAATAQGQATGDLLDKLGVGAKNADDFAAGIGRLTEQQRGVVAVGLAAELDKQIVAYEAAAKAADHLAFAAKAAAVTTFAGQGPEVTGVTGPTGSPGLVQQSAAVDNLRAAFRAGLLDARNLRDALVDYFKSQNEGADAATRDADKIVLADIALKDQASAIDLVIAKQTLLVDPTDKGARNTIAQAEAMTSAGERARAYSDTLQDLTDRLDASASKGDEFVRQQIARAKLAEADIAKLPEDQQPDARIRQQVLADAAREFFLAEQEREAKKKLGDETARLAVEQDKLGASYDKVAAAGQAAADAERQRLTDADGKPLAGADALVEKARQQAEAAELSRRADQLQASALNDLYKTFGVVTTGADAFADSITNLTDRQKALAAAGLETAIDRQKKALAEANQAVAGALAPPDQSHGDDVSAQAVAQAKARAQTLVDTYSQGNASLAELTDGLETYGGEIGKSDAETQRMIDTVVAAKTAQETLRQQYSVQVAELHRLTDALGETHGAFTQQDQDALDTTRSIAAATAATAGYRKALDDLRDAAGQSADPRRNAIDSFLKSHSLDTATIDKVQDPQEEARLRNLAAQAAALKGISFDNEKAAETERDHKAALDQVSSALDRGAQAYARVKGEKIKAGFSPEEAKQYAEDAKAIEAHNEATTKAASQQEFARKSSQDLAASERALAAIRGAGVNATKESLATLEAEQKVIATGITPRDKRYAQLVSEQTQLILNTKAGQDYLKQVSDLDKAREGLGEAKQIAALPVEGLSATREQRAELEASVEAIKAGFHAGTQEFDERVKLTAQTKLLLQAEQDRVRFAEQMAALSAKAEQARSGPVGLDVAGKPLDVAALVGLDTAALRDVEERAAAVKQAVLAIPDSLRKDAERGPQAIAEATRKTVDGYNAEADAKRRVAAVDLSGKAREELAYAQQKIVVDQQATPIRQQMQAQLQAENDLVQAGIDLDKLRYDPNAQQAYADAVRQRLQAIAQAEKDAANKPLIDAIAQPIEQIPQILGKSLDGVFSEINQKGKASLADIATGLAQGFQGIGQNFVGNALQVPFKLAGEEFSRQLQAALRKDGNAFANLFNGINDFAKGGLFQAGVVGAGVGSTVGGIGGTIGTAITGNPNTGLGGSLGGTVGGIAGGILGSFGGQPLLGALIGSGIGTALGSVLGGFFGGGTSGKNYDAFNSVYDPTTRTFSSTDNKGSQQNAEAARALAGQGADVLDTIRALGLGDTRGTFGFRVGPQGVDLGKEHFRTQEEALQALVRQMLDDTVGTVGETLTTVLKNTKAKNAQELQQDIQFAGTYDQLTNKSGTYGQALTQLQQQYGAAKVEAEKLGLSTKDLADAQTEAEAKLRATATLQVKQLEGLASPFAKALADLNDKFDQAEKDATALGISETELSAARKKQTEILKQQYAEQYAELTGQAGGYAQALFKLRDNFRQAAALGSDLGIDTSNLPQLQAQQEAKLRQQYVSQFNQLVNPTDTFAQSLQQLRDNFDQARDLAKELGLATTDLAAKQSAAEQKLARDAENRLQEQLGQQADSIRGFFKGIIDPLKNAISGAGALAGIVSPQQQLQASLAQFRETFGKAKADDLTALKDLPNQAQALLALAQKYGASSPIFAEILKEVQGDLKDVLGVQQGRANAVEASIPDTLRDTAQRQIDTLVGGFDDLKTQLQQLHQDFLSLGIVLPVQQQSVARTQIRLDDRQGQSANQNSIFRLAVDPPPANGALRAMVDPVPAGSLLASLLGAPANSNNLVAPTGARGAIGDLVRSLVDPVGAYIDQTLRSRSALVGAIGSRGAIDDLVRSLVGPIGAYIDQTLRSRSAPGATGSRGVGVDPGDRIVAHIPENDLRRLGAPDNDNAAIGRAGAGGAVGDLVRDIVDPLGSYIEQTLRSRGAPDTLGPRAAGDLVRGLVDPLGSYLEQTLRSRGAPDTLGSHAAGDPRDRLVAHIPEDDLRRLGAPDNGRPAAVDPSHRITDPIDRLIGRIDGHPIGADPAGSRDLVANRIRGIVDPLGSLIEHALRTRGAADPADAARHDRLVAATAGTSDAVRFTGIDTVRAIDRQTERLEARIGQLERAIRDMGQKLPRKAA